MSLIKLPQIQGGARLAHANTKKYNVQKFPMADAATTEFTITNKPDDTEYTQIFDVNDDMVQIEINHNIYYQDEDFTFDKSSGKITWINTAENKGFNLTKDLCDSIRVLYAYTYEDTLNLNNNSNNVNNDIWKYSIDHNLEHQTIKVAASADSIGNNATGYKSKVVFTPSVTSDLGYIAGTIKKTVDSTNHIVNFSANPVTETNKLIQDGWTPVYVINDENNKNYYTTTTPDDVNSFKAISSSDNIKNKLICGYYRKESGIDKLYSADFDQAYVGRQLVTDLYGEKIKNTYATRIGDNAFSDCSFLGSMDVPNVTSIGDFAFDGCTSLSSIDMSNVAIIGRGAFGDCISLTSIDVSNVTSIGEQVFGGCTSLTNIDVSKVTSIGDYAFSYCTSLTSIDASNAISIGEHAFEGCRALTSIDVSNVTSIGDSAFAECNKLKYIVINNNTVSTAHIEPSSGVKVLIPQSMMEAYSSDSYWSKYKSNLDAIENYTITRENGKITVTSK